jgi:hypothetical protein
MMQYNVCEICGAKDGRAGLLIGSATKPHACKNCHDTRETGVITIHSNLVRTEEEIKKTFAILENTQHPALNLTIYVVQNEKGQFFRAKGYGGGGNTWVDDINKAKLYGKIGGARGVITWFANNYPQYPTLKLLKLSVGGVEVIDETERVNKAKVKKEREAILKEQAKAKRAIEKAEEDLKRAQENLNRLKK